MKTTLMASPILAPGGAYWGVRMQNRSDGHLWRHYKRTFLAAQLAIGLVCWIAYQAAAPDLVPAATVFVIMQVSALVGSMWANRLRRTLISSRPSVLN
jgi:small-conductance mechanosensitive channel